MRLKILMLCAALVFTGAGPAKAATILEDRFTGVETAMPDGTTKLYPDRAKWAFTFWPGTKWPDSYGDGTNWLSNNGECQTYVTPFTEKVNGKIIPPALRYDPFTIEKDGLHIKGAPLSYEQMVAYQVGGYRRFGSGLLLSRTAFTYGKIRVVAKLPSARGSWPAIWLLAAAHHWPPELDPLEAMAWGPHATQVHLGMGPAKDDKSAAGYGAWQDVGVDLSKDFHEYGVDWTADTITFLFDGKPLVSRPTPQSLREDMYIIINLAVGGKWPYNELGVKPIDDKSAARLGAGSDLIQSDYPAEMIVKSVSVQSIGQ